MTDEPKDYYDIIREKISDPEIQKALDAFHARGVEEQRQAKETGAEPAATPAYESPATSGREPPKPFLPEAGRRAVPESGRRPAGERPYPPEIGERNARAEIDVPKNGQRQAESVSPPTQDPAMFRRYMRTPDRPPSYSGAPADDAYEAAYRAAMRRAAAGRTSKKRGQGAQFVTGIIVVLFAVFGLGCAVFFGVRGISSIRAKQSEERRALYNAKLISVAAVDPEAFEDISAARMEDLIKIAVWQLIGSGVDPNRYEYANGELCLPQADVESVYVACFGTQLPIAHQTVEGYGYTAKYSAEDAAYYVPMTTLEPIYTPKVVNVENKSGATVVTCGLISSGMWKQDRTTGDIVLPEPDKYVRVTFRTSSGAEYISSLQSLGLPETALPSGVPAESGGEENTAVSPSEETTTEKQIVITWD